MAADPAQQRRQPTAAEVLASMGATDPAAPAFDGTAGAAAAAAGATAATSLTAAQATAAAASIVKSVLAFGARRNQADYLWVVQALRQRYPEKPESEVEALARKEVAYGREFTRKQRDRLERDLPAALGLDDPAERAARVAAILDREKRYLAMRREAMAERAIAAAELDSVRAASAEGAFWMLSPYAAQHTPLCVALGNKFWPWAALDAVPTPPIHAGCRCSLLTKREAVQRGLMHEDQVPDEADAVARATHYAATIEEALRSGLTPDDLREALREHLLDLARVDALYERFVVEEAGSYYGASPWQRFSTGFQEGGQFKGRRAGVRSAGRKLGKFLSHLDLRTPAQMRRDGAAQPMTLNGQSVNVPEHRAFDRHIGGVRFTSPPGSRRVYADGKALEPGHPLLRPEPGKPSPAVRAPAEDAQRQRAREVEAHAERTRADLQLPATSSTAAALERPGRAKPTWFEGADGHATHSALATLGFREAGTTRSPGSHRTSYVHPATGTALDVSYHDDTGRSFGADWRPQGARRQVPRPVDRKPGTAEEFAGYLAGFVEHQGARHGVETHLRTVHFDDSLNERGFHATPDHAGSHEWSGDVILGADVKPAVEAAIRKRDEGRQLSEAEARDLWTAYRVAHHESLHGVNPVDQATYETPHGANLEEWLTEEAAAPAAHEALRAHGFEGAADWAAAHPLDPRVQGSYLRVRASADRLLDEAKVAPEDRARLVQELKLAVPPEEREARLAALLREADPRMTPEEALGRVRSAFEAPGRIPEAWTPVGGLPGEGRAQPLGGRPEPGARVLAARRVRGERGYTTRPEEAEVLSSTPGAGGRWIASVRWASDGRVSPATDREVLRQEHGQPSAPVDLHLPGRAVTRDEIGDEHVHQPKATLAAGDPVAWDGRADGGVSEGTVVRVHRGGDGWLVEAEAGPRSMAPGERVLLTPERVGGAIGAPGEVRPVATAATRPSGFGDKLAAAMDMLRPTDEQARRTAGELGISLGQPSPGEGREFADLLGAALVERNRDRPPLPGYDEGFQEGVDRAMEIARSGGNFDDVADAFRAYRAANVPRDAELGDHPHEEGVVTGMIWAAIEGRDASAQSLDYGAMSKASPGFDDPVVSPGAAEEFVAGASYGSTELWHATTPESAAAIGRGGLDPKLFGSGAGGQYGSGFYMASKPSLHYGDSHVRVATRLENPLRGTRAEVVAEVQRRIPGKGTADENAARIRDGLLEQGVDGLVMEMKDGTTWVVAFRPDSVRVVDEAAATRGKASPGFFGKKGDLPHGGGHPSWQAKVYGGQKQLDVEPAVDPRRLNNGDFVRAPDGAEWRARLTGTTDVPTVTLERRTQGPPGEHVPVVPARLRTGDHVFDKSGYRWRVSETPRGSVTTFAVESKKGRKRLKGSQLAKSWTFSAAGQGTVESQVFPEDEFPGGWKFVRSGFGASKQGKSLTQSLGGKPKGHSTPKPPKTDDGGQLTYAEAGPGGAAWYTDKSGQRWLVQGWKGDANKVAGDLLANSVYRELGVDVPAAQQFTFGGKPAYGAPQGAPEWRYRWPAHGVQGTPGAEIDPRIAEVADAFVDKGTDRQRESYSAFDGTVQGGGGLADYLRGKGVKRVEVGGLATDYCVRDTALAARREGFQVSVLRSAIAGIDAKPGDVEASIKAMEGAGVKFVDKPKPSKATALVAVDVQADFLPGGALGVPDGDQVIPPLVGAAKSGGYATVVASRDWHPADHQSFLASKPQGDPGYAADALLGNWNAGDRLRLGGSLLWHPKGGKKSFGAVPTEMWSLDSPKGPLLGEGPTPEAKVEQARQAAEKLTPGRIQQLVDAAPFSDEEARKAVADALKRRVEWMGRLGSGQESLPEPLRGGDARAELAAGQEGFEVRPEEVAALEGFEADPAAANAALHDSLRFDGQADEAQLASIGGAPVEEVPELPKWEGPVEVGEPVGPTPEEALAEWEKRKGKSQPKISAGVIVREPDGRVWMMKPKGGFGGYGMILPKGRVDEGEDPQEAALRELYEETGLTAKITGLVGDYVGDVTITRYFTAERTGGRPEPKAESELVVLGNQLEGGLRERDVQAMQDADAGNVPAEVSQQILGLDGLLRDSPKTTEDMEAWALLPGELPSATAGQTLASRGFLGAHLERPSGKGTLVRLLVPEGTRAFSPRASDLPGPGLLLARGTRMKILYFVEEAGKRIAVGVVLPA